MKRNNIFMWSYIAFIIISMIIRGHIDFMMWTPIVIAITVSSAFFAVEDLLVSVAGFYKDSLDNHEEALSISKKVVEQEAEYLSKKDIWNQRGEALHIDTSKYIMQPIEVKNLLADLERTNKEAEQVIESQKSKILKYQKSANVVTFFGFLCLFCILIICEFLEIPSFIQEMLSVFSFAVILVTQQVSETMQDKIKLEKESINRLSKSAESVMFKIRRHEKS